MDRVLHVNWWFFGLTETFVYNIIRNIKQFEPILCAFKFTEEALKYKHYKLLPWIGKIESYFHPPLFGLIKKRISNFIRENRIKIVHAHFGETGALLSSLKENVPLVVSFYGSDASMLTRKERWRKRYYRLFKKADLVIVEGPIMKKRLEKIGCPAEKIRIIPIGVDFSMFTKREEKRGCPIRILFTGRFVEKKGIMDSLRAIELLVPEFNEFKFTMIGDGPLRGKIINFIKKKNLKNYVTLLGNLSYKEYLSQLSQADIYLHPSCMAKNGDSEGGAPTTIIEAQGMGIPIVSTYHSDIPFVTLPQKSALLFAEHDVEGIKEGLLKLCKNASLREKLGNEGKKFVISQHSVKNVVSQIEREYKVLCNAD